MAILQNIFAIIILVDAMPEGRFIDLFLGIIAIVALMHRELVLSLTLSLLLHEQVALSSREGENYLRAMTNDKM
jgi:hypothetical protein